MLAPGPGKNAWELVVSEDFSGPDAIKGWVLDGPGQASVTDGQLLVETQRAEVDGQKASCSVFWRPTPVWGDLRFEFDARAEMKNRCIFFFNAQPLKGCKSIFEWKRPLARYMDYAGEERMQLYTLGMLRYDQDAENLRVVGGPLARFLKEMEKAPRGPERKRLNQAFQKKTIFQSHPSVAKDPEKMAHFVLTAVGARLTLEVDGRQIFDVVDEQRAANPLKGGFFGFRNFRPTKAWYDNLKVYRRAGSGG